MTFRITASLAFILTLGGVMALGDLFWEPLVALVFLLVAVWVAD